MNNIKNTNELKKIAEESAQECPYLININKAPSVWAEIWDNFCPRGGSVSYFIPDNEEVK